MIDGSAGAAEEDDVGVGTILLKPMKSDDAKIVAKNNSRQLNGEIQSHRSGCFMRLCLS